MVKRICLISPGHVAFNPRLVKEADALSLAGYDVHIIAANNLEHVRRLDQPILATANWSFELVGDDCKMLNFLRRGRSRLARETLTLARFENIRLYEWAHHSLVDQLKQAATRHCADLYIAHYVAALPAAHFAALQHDASWAFDAEDYHRGEFRLDQMDGISARAVVAIENEYLPHITYFTAASEGIAAAYVRNYNLPLPQVVLNVFPISNAPAAPTECGRAKPGPSVYWFSQTIGTDRGLECAVRAIAIARSKPHLYLRGNLQAGFKSTLMALAESTKVADRIHFLAPAPGAEMERLASEYDIGFVGEPGHTENRRIALTNKLFSFLLAGLPVIASDIEAHREIAKACDAVITFAAESSAELAKAFDNLLLNPHALAEAREKSWQAGQQRYNWDQERKKVISAAASHIGRPIGSSGICV